MCNHKHSCLSSVCMYRYYIVPGLVMYICDSYYFSPKAHNKVFVIQSDIFWMKYKAVLETQYCALISLHLVRCNY